MNKKKNGSLLTCRSKILMFFEVDFVTLFCGISYAIQVAFD